MTHMIVACMRDEALFTVEWIAHHLALGFDRIVVYTNDCSDGTDSLLRAISTAAPVDWFDNPGPYDAAGTIQKTALAAAAAMPALRAADWVLHIDADEYLNVTCGDRSISALTALYPQADAIAVQWRHFGKGDVQQWDGGSVLDSFVRAEDKPATPQSGRSVAFKTIFRPAAFGKFGVHTPKFPVTGKPPVVVNTAGTPMPTEKMMQERGSGYDVDAAQCSWKNACLHHHHVKSDDLHRLKHARGDANGRRNAKRRIGSDYYHQANLNDVTDLSISHYRPARMAWENRLRAIPGVTDLEQFALARLRQLYQQE